MCFAGDAVVRNSVINYVGTGVGFMFISSGETNRQIYIHNNVLSNCNPSLLFRNKVSVSGRVSNNILVAPTILGVATPTGGSRASSMGVTLDFNGMTSSPQSGIVTVGGNVMQNPDFAFGGFYTP
jgi:hypothetical protein